MTEQTNAELLTEAYDVLSRPIRADHESEEARGVIQRLADALEAAEKRAAEYAAVIEKALAVANDSDQGDSFLPTIVALESAPADVLREHDAKVRAEALREFAGVVREVAALGPENTGLRKPAHLAEYAANYADRIEREAGLK